MTTLGLRPAAVELGISHVALLKAARKGRVHRLSDGSFDVDACRIELGRNSNIVKQQNARKQQRNPAAEAAKPPVAPRQAVVEPVPEVGSAESEPDESFFEAQRQKEWIRVEKEKLDLAKRRGELIELAPINAWVAGMIIKARDEALRISQELRDRLAQESDPIACEEMLTRRLRQTFEQLSEYRLEQSPD